MHPIVVGSYGEGPPPVLTGVELGKGHTLLRLDSCQHIRVHDIHLIGGQFSQRFLSITGSTSSHISILRMMFANREEVQYNPDNPKVSRYWGDGVYFSDAPGSEYHHIEIGNCVFIGIGGFRSTQLNKADAINVGKPLSHFWIHDNQIYHCNEGIDVAGGTDHIIENNLIVETTEFQGIKVHSQYSHVENTVIRGNVIIAAKSWGLALENISKCSRFPTQK